MRLYVGGLSVIDDFVDEHFAVGGDDLDVAGIFDSIVAVVGVSYPESAIAEGYGLGEFCVKKFTLF